MGTNYQSVDLSTLLTPVIAAAREAGKAILEVYSTDFSVELKNDNSPLTLADKLSHEIIVRRLTEITGDTIPILSEEGKDIPYEERKKWDYFWLVDPLDGTREFIKRNGEFTVNIALIREQRPVLGVIYVPVADILYAAYEEVGAYKEGGGLRVKLPEQHPGKRFTIVGSSSHGTEELAAFVEEAKLEYGEVDFISAGSSLKFCLVAEGKAEVYPRLGPTMEWDTAAGQAIAELAGASVTEMETNKPLTYNKQSLLNPWFMVSGPNWRKRND